MSLSTKLKSNRFLKDESGTTAIEFCLVLPIFAALSFFVLDISKAYITALQGAAEARTAAWMSARLEVEIDGNYRAMPKKVSGITLFRPFCDNGNNGLSETYLEDKLPSEDFVGKLRNKSTLEGEQIFEVITNSVGEQFFRTECVVNDFAYSNRGANRFRFFKIQEKALVPNVKTLRFDESSSGQYDIACGYDKPLLDGLKKDGFGEMNTLFPNLFPRAKDSECLKQ